MLAADAPDHDLEIRFFSPRREVTFIGHATMAAHYVRAIANGVPKGKVRQKSGNAIVEVEVHGQGPGPARHAAPEPGHVRARSCPTSAARRCSTRSASARRACIPPARCR